MSALRLDSILSPLTSMLDKFLIFIPNIITAGLILAMGWFIAFKIKEAVKEILESLNIEEKLVVSEKKLFEGKLLGVLANIAYILILISVFTAILSYIGLGYVTQPVIDTIRNSIFIYPEFSGSAYYIVSCIFL